MTASGPPLSVVVVSWNAAGSLPAMLESLRLQAIPGLELVVVDNGSIDGSAELVERDWPGAIVVRQGANTGFSAAASAGVARCAGSAVALLNYDVVLHPGYLSRCLAELDARPGLGSVQGLLLRPGGHAVDSAGHAVSRGRWFRNRGENQDPGARRWAPAAVFGVTAAAAVYRRRMLDDVSAVTGHLFDPAFFAYLEDVDLDYRANWRGWDAAVVAGATAEHVHSGSGARHQAALQRHILKNRLLVLYRNEDLGSLLLDLPWVSGQLAARLALAAATAPSSLLGIWDFLRLLPAQHAVRDAIASGRRVSPRALRRKLRSPAEGAGLHTRTRARAGLTGEAGSPRLLMICGEPLGARMAGPAIRSFELGRACAAAGIQVTFAAPAGAGGVPLSPGMRLVQLRRRVLSEELRGHDAVMIGAGLLSRFPQLLSATLPLAVDLYVPVPLEAAQLFRGSPRPVLRAAVAQAEANQRLELARADLVLCASEIQQGLYERIASDAHPGRAPSFRVVPFGVPDLPPPGADGRLRAAIPGVQAGDRVVLWGGGLHDWFEPELVVDAVADAAVELPDLRLVFLGTRPPNRALQAHGAAARAADRALQRGVLDKHVFFLPGWVPYAERGAYLVDADVGVSAHLAGPETTYSWRTRLLDYAWAGLPVVATAGDPLSAQMAAAGAAELVSPGDRAALAAALRALLTDGDRRSRAHEASLRVAQELRWSRVAEPLVAWVREPKIDHLDVSGREASLALWRMYAVKGAHALVREGPGGVLRRTRRFRGRG